MGLAVRLSALFGLTRRQDWSEDAFDFPKTLFHPRRQSALGGERSELAIPGFRRRQRCGDCVRLPAIKRHPHSLCQLCLTYFARADEQKEIN